MLIIWIIDHNIGFKGIYLLLNMMRVYVHMTELKMNEKCVFVLNKKLLAGFLPLLVLHENNSGEHIVI